MNRDDESGAAVSRTPDSGSVVGSVIDEVDRILYEFNVAAPEQEAQQEEEKV